MNLTVCGLLTIACTTSNIIHFNNISSEENVRLVVFTVATEETDGYTRFMQSASLYGIKVTVLGMGKEWRGGDMARYPGGGQKINLLKEGMDSVRNQSDVLVMFVDSYDVVFTAGPADILKAFRKFNASLVFSAEPFCWPDENFQILYPEVTKNEKRFLNSGGFLGYAPQLYSVLSTSRVYDDDDDQLFYTQIFLNSSQRNEFNMKLDTRSLIFQNLNGAVHEMQLKFKGSTTYLYNNISGSIPLIIHGNGPIKIEFNRFTNYIANQWSPRSGCAHCEEKLFNLSGIKDEDLPRIFVAIFVEQPTPFLEEFFEHFLKLIYPKSRLYLFLHYRDHYHDKHVDGFLSLANNQYSRVELHRPQSGLNDWTARDLAVERFFERECQYFLSLDGNVQLENRDTLKHLIQTNRSMIAPMVSRPGGVWSNYWGDIDTNGYYKRSEDYYELLDRTRRGIWKVPYVTSIYLIHAHRMPLIRHAFKDTTLDSDMAVCRHLRDLGVFMYLDNQHYFGHLVNYNNFPTHHLHNDLYSIIENQYTWEKKYIHSEYFNILKNVSLQSIEQPCPDVYWLPIVSPVFCKHLVEEMENFGQWSSGGNEDARIEGGYENVPTVDIHTNQIDWEPQWLHFLKHYISPIGEKLYIGYISDARAHMNFVVRYRIDDMDRLEPHNDASTYTINIALNRHGIDYEGGGTHFLRYNCSVIKSRLGWMIVHPGRLTHYHEGLPTLSGNRYIMVSFIDP